MIFSIPHLIGYASKIMTLEERDIILTGMPKGVGPIREYDEIQAGIHGVISMRQILKGGKARVLNLYKAP